MCSRKSVLENTKWTAQSRIFVADAGYETTTATLEFHPGNQFVMKMVSVLPAHPAMYRNADGTIDTIPARRSEYEEKGTYKISGDKLKLIYEDGLVREIEMAGVPAKGGSLDVVAIRGFSLGPDEFVFTKEAAGKE